MKESKHIDRIFQEKLKDFDATPNDSIWGRINAELHQEDSDRKIIPVWWKIAGIAASLLLMITVGYSVLNDSDETNNNPTEIVDTNNESNNTKDKNNTETSSSHKKDTPDELLNNNLVPENQTVSNTVIDDSDEKTRLTNSEVEVSTNKENANTNRKDAVVNSNQLKTNNRNDRSNTNDVYNRVSNSENVSVAGTQQNSDTKTTGFSNKNATANTTVVNNEIPQNLPEQPMYKNNISKEVKDATLNPSNTDGIAVVENSSEEVKKEEDIKNITDETKTSIEEAMAASEDGEDYDEKEKEVIDRWSVAANVSPVYYNTLGKGSSIHDEFNSNSKNGQLNMAYGVNASYAISDKLSVRSGVGMVNVGYNTNDILVYNSLGSPTNPQPVAAANGAVFRNIDLKDEAQGITVISGETLAFSQVPGVVSESFKSTLNQEMSFIEIPVELEYKLSDKKLGISLIGGFSTMILNGNEVYTQLNDERTLLGEANNINNISYSANFGVGLGVKISDKINLNFEPNFRYQIKTFNNTSGDFKPYIIGVNSGLKFKF
jgi:hypothetical protein